MKNLKAVTPIIAGIALLVIATAAVIAYNEWFSPFTQRQLSDSSELGDNDIQILSISSSNVLSIRVFSNNNITINNLTIGDTGCSPNLILNASRINTINVTTCVNGNPSGNSQQSVSVITDKGVFKEKLVINN